MKIIKKSIILISLFCLFTNGLFAQAFPQGHFWSLDGGIGMSDALVSGYSVQAVIEPKLWLSKPFMIGTKLGINYSSENDGRDILALETQFFFRWNFLYLGNPQNTINIFAQGGIGLLAAYRGNEQNPNNLFSDKHMTRGSALAEIAAGVTIPLTERWHIEPVARFGYPHIWGVSVTAGYKFRLPGSGYNDIINTLPPAEIVKRIMISSVEYILFAGDIARYNVNIDRDAQGLNELVLNSIAQFLKDNPDCVVRIDGHANPVTADPREAEELLVLSRQRTNAVAEQLRQRGIRDEQMVLIYHGGSRTVIPQSDTEHWNRNRRVELVLMQMDFEMDTN